MSFNLIIFLVNEILIICYNFLKLKYLVYYYLRLWVTSIQFLKPFWMTFGAEKFSTDRESTEKALNPCLGNKLKDIMNFDTIESFLLLYKYSIFLNNFFFTKHKLIKTL